VSEKKRHGPTAMSAHRFIPIDPRMAPRSHFLF